jgi:hypothetical protein
VLNLIWFAVTVCSRPAELVNREHAARQSIELILSSHRHIGHRNSFRGAKRLQSRQRDPPRAL